MLDLGVVLRGGNKNVVVLGMNYTEVKGKLGDYEYTTTFEDEFGGICGNFKAVLVEGSLKQLFSLSDIKFYFDKDVVTFYQDGLVYSAKTLICSEGCTIEDLHIDFNTLERLGAVSSSSSI
ncbi:hypothetical protein D3C81_10730 [compost metagenome]